MAKTLIGQLLIRLRAEGANEANKLTGAMHNIERAAKDLNGVRMPDWGSNFQRNLSKLKLAPHDINAVTTSWTRLQESIRSMPSADRHRITGSWRTEMMAALAQRQVAMQEAFKAEQALARTHSGRMRSILRTGLAAGGFGMGAYGGGQMTREAFLAASDQSRARAENELKGLSKTDRDKINAKAAGMADKHGISEARGMEILGDASMNMKSVDAAIAVGDAQAQAFKLMSVRMGPEMAIGAIRAFNKGMDNLNVDDAGLYTRLLENAVKASHVTGKDFNPGDLFQTIKYARSAGKFYDKDFMTQVAPFIAAQTGASDAGTQLRAAWDQFAVGKATKGALAAQTEYGLRKDGKLVGLDEFAANPVAWAAKYMLPALTSRGISLDSPEFAVALGEMSSNRLSSDFFASAIKSWVEGQLPRQLDHAKKAGGLDSADTLQDKDLLTAWENLKAGLADLSSAVIPAEGVAKGLNWWADALRGLTDLAKENPTAAQATTGVGAAGAVGVGAWSTMNVLEWFTGLKGGVDAGAATAVTGGGLFSGLLQGGLALAGSPVALTAGAVTITTKALTDMPQKAEFQHPDTAVRAMKDADDRNAGRAPLPPVKPYEPKPITDIWGDIKNMFTFQPEAETAGMVADVKAAANEAEGALNIKGRADIDTSALDVAISKASNLLSILRQAGSASSAASANMRNIANQAVKDADAKIPGEMRRNLADRHIF